MSCESGRDVRRDLARAVVTQNWGLLEMRPTRMSLEDIFLSLTTGETMGNILAIAEKELKSYFASPIAYVIIGFFALVFGYFYTCRSTASSRWPCRWAPRARAE